MAKPCDGVRVLDLTQGMPGNLAAMVLADFGADVLHIEPPEGDRWRSHPGWSFWNRGKRCLRLDLKSTAGRGAFARLIPEADVVVESFRPGVTARLGIDYAAVQASNSGIVYCSITGFGASGPYAQLRGYEGVVDALSGRMLEFGAVAGRRGPAFAALPAASTGAMHGALQGILAALLERAATGAGCHVETSLLQGLTPYDLIRWSGYQLVRTGDEETRERVRPFSAPAAPGATLRPAYLTAVTEDGVWLQFANTMAHLYKAQMVALGLASLYEDPRFANLPAVANLGDARFVWRAVLERVRSKPWSYWKPIFDADPDVSVEPFATTQQAFDHPQVRHNGHVVAAGGGEQAGPIAALRATPGEAGGAPESVSDPLGVTFRPRPDTPVGLAPTLAPEPGRPLAGLTIVDFATYYASPYGAALLADYGARVIKVEPPAGEPGRFGAGHLLPWKATAGKESIAVDLKRPEGREIVQRLVANADIVLHNFRPGVPEKLGIGYEQVRTLNPNVVYHYGASYGSDGPFAAKAAFHPTAGAITGTALIQAPPSSVGADDAVLPIEELERQAWRLMTANEGNPDATAALGVASALLLGLHARMVHGAGQSQETTMICSNLYANGDDAFRFPGKPPRAEPDRELFGLGALYRLYRASDGWLFLAACSQGEWVALAAALDHAEWTSDARFVTVEARERNDAALTVVLEAELGGRSADETVARLAKHDVACVRADRGSTAEFLCEDPSNLELSYARHVEHPRRGAYLRHGPIAAFDGARPPLRPLCEIGEQSGPILMELGYSGEEIAALGAAGVVTVGAG